MRDRFTYPTNAELRAQSFAEARDADDLDSLKRLRAVVADALARIREIPDIYHPHARWSPVDLTGCLRDQLLDIDGTVEMINAELVVEG